MPVRLKRFISTLNRRVRQVHAERLSSFLDSPNSSTIPSETRVPSPAAAAARSVVGTVATVRLSIGTSPSSAAAAACYPGVTRRSRDCPQCSPSTIVALWSGVAAPAARQRRRRREDECTPPLAVASRRLPRALALRCTGVLLRPRVMRRTRLRDSGRGGRNVRPCAPWPAPPG